MSSQPADTPRKENRAKNCAHARRLVVPTAAAIIVHISFVVALLVAGPGAVERFPLNLNFPDAALPLATDFIRDLYQMQDVLLCRVSSWLRLTCFTTYVSEVLHDVEEVICLFACIAHRVNGFSDNQVLCDFGPHVLLALLDGSLVVMVSEIFANTNRRNGCR